MPDYTIVNQTGGRLFSPYLVALKEPIRYIFPVPQSDAVGTIDFDNAITILGFRGDGPPAYEIVAKNFLSEVVGDFDFGFCPVFSDEIIAYTQTRWAVVANIKTGKVSTPILTRSMYEMIGGIAPLDTTNNLFTILWRTPAGRAGFHKIIHVMRLENKKMHNLGELPAGIDGAYSTPWLVHDKKIITYDSAATRLLCHDGGLQPASHPFVDIFNRHSGTFRKLKEMIIHPTLPFGLVVEIGKDWDFNQVKNLPMDVFDKLAEQREIHALYLIRWDTTDTTKQFIPLHNDSLSLISPFAAKQYGRLSFSPDGKWLVFGHEDRGRDSYGKLGPGGDLQPFFVALPVDEQKPFFFAEPLFMGRSFDKYNLVTTTAWTTNPTAFVVADGQSLYKWDLGRLSTARTVTTPDTLFPLE
jgi:hypothetical protein